MKLTHVILSGGVGSRLWPLSRKSCPKQYIPLLENRQTLFQRCVERNQGICERLIVVGNKNNYLLSQENLVSLGIQNFTSIVEATPRNTAAAITFAALASEPDDILLITPSDHVITNQKVYNKIIQEAAEMAENGFLVTFGIHPTRPETGFGYIAYNGKQVVSFIEKPNLEKAVEMLAKGNYLWNSGMFCFKASVFLEEIKKYNPEVLEKARKAWEQQKEDFLPLDLSLKIPSISVDYAVMEHSDKIKVVLAKGLGWSDLGTYESLWDYYLEKETSKIQNKNMVIGNQKPVFFVGTEQMVYVETPDAILILPKNKSAEVKGLYEDLEKKQPGLVD